MSDKSKISIYGSLAMNRRSWLKQYRDTFHTADIEPFL